MYKSSSGDAKEWLIDSGLADATAAVHTDITCANAHKWYVCAVAAWLMPLPLTSLRFLLILAPYALLRMRARKGLACRAPVLSSARIIGRQHRVLTVQQQRAQKGLALTHASHYGCCIRRNMPVNIRMLVNVHVCTCECMDACIRMRLCMHVYMCVCMCACMYVCMHACLHLCVYVCPGWLFC